MTDLKPSYNELSNVRGTTIDTDEETRTSGLTQAAAQYRLIHGPRSLPVGTAFRMKWPDGSGEAAVIVSPTSAVGALPIPQTQCRTCNFPILEV